MKLFTSYIRELFVQFLKLESNSKKGKLNSKDVWRSIVITQRSLHKEMTTGIGLRALKPFILYLLLLKNLFCVCLTYARQLGVYFFGRKAKELGRNGSYFSRKTLNFFQIGLLLVKELPAIVVTKVRRTAEFGDERYAEEGRTTARRDELPKTGTDDALGKTYRCLHKVDMTVRHPELVWRTTGFRNERHVALGSEKSVPVLSIPERNAGKKWWQVQKRWRDVSFFWRNAKKLGRNAFALKLSALSFSLSIFLFCVCLTRARQQGLGTPAATGVDLKIVPLLQIKRRNQGKNRREVQKWWRGVSFFWRDAKKLERNAITSKQSASSFSLTNFLFCVCLARARQQGLGNPVATGVALMIVPPLQITWRNQGENRRTVQKRWRGVSFFRRDAKKLGQNTIPLKRSALSISFLIFLFCVCLAHARQQGLGNPAATGVAFQNVLLKGKVVSAESNDPFQGATVAIKNTNIKVLTDVDGTFSIAAKDREGVLVISYVGYRIKEVPFNSKTEMSLTVQLIASNNVLDEAVVIGYGQTTRRLNTGSVTKISAEDISKQPVGNPLAALQGRVPGMVVTQTSGVPGAAINVQIRGRSSLDLARSRNEPLFIIDGVPYLMGNEIANQLATAANNPTQTSQGGLSPLNMINPADIKSIEVLKDADATAIYGSRGANGVILITTKKGQAGELRLSFQSYAGWSSVTRTMDFMNTEQFLALRREAFRNDGLEPTVSNAPDLLLWDTARYTDWKKELIGGVGSTADMQLRASGGNQYTRFNMGLGYRNEGTVFPGSQAGKRTSVSLGLDHHTPDNKLEFNFSGNYSYNVSDLTARDLTLYANLPPNFPSPYDENSRLKFSEAGVSFAALGLENPYAYLLRRYRGNTANLIGNLQLSYRLYPWLVFRSSFGYNSIVSEERSINPSTSIDPQSGALPSANFANGNGKSWIIEPQLEFTEQWGASKFSALLGATWQSLDSRNSTIMATGFANDLLLYSMNAASDLYANNSFSLYRYTALFGRLNYNWKDTYILNLTGRRDGSSRFGPENRFANFGALGAAWLFGNEEWLKNSLSFLSFGKFRASYGITGNDQIGDYFYLDTWTSTLRPYDGLGGLRPSRLYNPNFKWEINKKLELGMELGAIDDRILLSAAYYQNRSSNQLVSYALPGTTGFNNVSQNLDALVKNTGIELSLSTENVKEKDFKWLSSINITFPKTRLLAFPDLEGSSYANRYEIGQPLNVIKAYRFLGVDRESGIYTYDDVNGDGNLNAMDYVAVGHTDPIFFGGVSNTFNLGGFELLCFFEFRKQKGQNYYAAAYSYPPGFIFNQPQMVNDHWRQPGDDAAFQKLTSRAGNPAYVANSRLLNSSAAYGDASFVRLKTLSLSYQFLPALLEHAKLKSLKVYMQGQNLLTWTGYKGADPENQNLFMLPPVKTFTLGLQATF